MVVFNEIHNQHLQTSVGIVSILTEDNKRVYKNLRIMDDITYENEFKVKNENFEVICGKYFQNFEVICGNYEN